MAKGNKKPRAGYPNLEADEVDDEISEIDIRRAQAQQMFGNMVPGSKSEELWLTYGVKPNLPFRTKLEQLTILYRLTIDEMAVLLECSPTTISDEMEKLRAEWKTLGRTLEPDDRDEERGRLLTELNRLAADIDTALAAGLDKDPRLLQLKLTVVDRRAKLQGLDFDKKEVPAPEAAEETVMQRAARKIQQIPTDRLDELVKKLE